MQYYQERADWGGGGGALSKKKMRDGRGVKLKLLLLRIQGGLYFHFMSCGSALNCN